VRVKERIEPDLARHQAYRYFVNKYIETYPRLRDLIQDMTRHNAS
jgi:sugar (pentulose or hexulose) kinase